VDEQEWLECEDPETMLEFLRGWASERKLRLFACACVRRVWHLLRDRRSRWAVEMAEQYADGLATEKELTSAYAVGAAVLSRAGLERPSRRRTFAAEAAAWAANCAVSLEEAAQRAAECCAEIVSDEEWEDECDTQCRLLRCIVGNPFRPLPARPFPPHLVGLAETCESPCPAFSADFLILADALDELGEEQPAAHCRELRHVKGCHVLDWILHRD